MVGSATNADLIYSFLGLLASAVLGCPGVHPLESIVPERDLPPRNFNPHPYVSVVAEAAVLSNFDHPYAAIASKRSEYVRSRPKTVEDNDQPTTSINSLTNFARCFLGLTANGKKQIVTSDPISKINLFSGTPKFSSNLNNYYTDKDHARRHSIVEYAKGDSQYNGQVAQSKFAIGDDFGDGNGNGNGERITHLSSTPKYQRHQLYPGKTLNLASVQQSSLNEDALSLRDTNDNLSQGFYVTTSDEHRFQSGPHDTSDIFDIFNYLRLNPMTRGAAHDASTSSVNREVSITSGYLRHQYQDWVVTDVPLRRIESRNKPSYFKTLNSNYRYSNDDQFQFDRSHYPSYSSF